MYYTYGEKAELTHKNTRNVLISFATVSDLFHSHFSLLFLLEPQEMML